MKKLLLLAPLFIGAFTYGQATVCDQNVINANANLAFAMIPDTVANLPVASVNQSYETLLHFKIPTNLNDAIPILNGTIDYGTVNTISGLPQGFMWECLSSTTNTILAGQWGCFRIYSNDNIDVALVGTYPLTVNVSYQANISLPFGNIPTSSSTNTNGYKIVIGNENPNNPDPNNPDPNNPDPNDPDPNNPDPNNPDPNDPDPNDPDPNDPDPNDPDPNDPDPNDPDNPEQPGVSINTITDGVITIYPNPAKDFISLMNMKEIDQIIIYNVAGELIDTFNLNGSEEKTISIEKFAIGTYIIHLKNEKTSQVIRLIKH